MGPMMFWAVLITRCRAFQSGCFSIAPPWKLTGIWLWNLALLSFCRKKEPFLYFLYQSGDVWWHIKVYGQITTAGLINCPKNVVGSFLLSSDEYETLKVYVVFPEMFRSAVWGVRPLSLHSLIKKLLSCNLSKSFLNYCWKKKLLPREVKKRPWPEFGTPAVLFVFSFLAGLTGC